MDDLVSFSSTRTEENGALLGACVYVVGGEVLLQAFRVGDCSEIAVLCN